MKFGHFFYPMNPDPSRDSSLIDECLLEAELVERLGLEAIWLSEHHFVGEAAYGDPLVFGAAIATRTKRVTIGLGIVEMALHNPVQLAIQTSLLDNLCHGRLIVGTGRGSNYNAFEYVGFGTTVEEGRERLLEAEDLLVKAWTTPGLDYKGEHWQVTFPAIRPEPYQKPHPRLARACISHESIISMAKIGRPVLFRGRSIESVGESISLFKRTMESEGFSNQDVEDALENCWVWYEAHLAETNEQAWDEFLPAFQKASLRMADMRRTWNPPNQEVSRLPLPLDRSEYKESPNPKASESLVGSPERMIQHVKMLQAVGARNLMLTNRSLVSTERTSNYLHLLSEKVMPEFR